MRKCGDCQMCCRLLPVRELGKDANTRCDYQKRGVGCTVHGTAAMPPSCRLWNCRWLLEDDTADLGRPDRTGYVVDVMPDFVTFRHDDSGELQHWPVLQIWIDPLRPDAWRNDRNLRAYLDRRAKADGMLALVRRGVDKGVLVLMAPSLNSSGKWAEREGDVAEETHRPEDFEKVGMSYQVVIEER